jgi:hypothetical protein
MTDTDLFSPDVNKNDFDPNKNYLEELVGDGKKFKDVDALARGKAESDAFIENLKLEQKNLREDYQRLLEENKTRTRLEDIIDKLSKAQEKPNDDPADTTGDNRGDTKSGIDPNEINSLIDSKINETRARERAEANLKLVKDKLSETYGSKYPEALRETTEKLGLSTEEINRLAANSPQAVIELMAKATERFDIAPPQNRVNSSGFTAKKPEVKNYSYFEKMRVEQPDKYNTPQIQQERWKSARELGEDFFDV